MYIQLKYQYIAGNALVTPPVLRVSLGGCNRLPSDDQSTLRFLAYTKTIATEYM